MQEHSLTLPMCSIGCASHDPSATVNLTVGPHASNTDLSNESSGTALESAAASTPELNLLLDKLTEILRFRSNCRRHFGGGVAQSHHHQPLASATTLKRLQPNTFEAVQAPADASSLPSTNSPASTSAWKSSQQHCKASLSGRPPHHYHHKHHATLPLTGAAFERRRRLPCLLQRLVDEGNLIKEAVRRLKSQRFPHTSNLPSNALQTPSTPTTNSSTQMPSHTSSRITPSASTSMFPPAPLADSPTQAAASPNRGISWFLSSNVFAVHASTTGHNSGSGSPLRACGAPTAHDRMAMEIGIHDG